MLKQKITKNRISLIFQNKFAEKVINIKDCSNGVEQIVKIIETNKEKYIIKFPKKGNELMIFKEAFVCKMLNKESFAPKIIFKEKDYLIESFIKGEALYRLKYQKNNKKIYRSLGKLIKTIHNVKMRGFGELQINEKGKYAKFSNYVKFFIKKEMPFLRKTMLFSEKEEVRILKYIKAGIKYIEQTESSLLHGDLIDGNVLVENKKISGIIDFGDAGCGPCSYDLAKIYIEKDGNIFSEVMKGYGKNNINMKEIKYFAVFHLMYMIPYFYSTNKKQKYNRLINLLKETVDFDLC